MSVLSVNIDSFNKIALSESAQFKADHHWCFDTEEKRNLYRVSVAGGLSAIGAWVGGLLPTTVGILVGGVLSGIGNGLSTWLAWEKKEDPVLQARLVTDYSALDSRCNQMQREVDRIKGILPASFANSKKEPPKEAKAEPIKPWYWRTVGRRNFIRVSIAGALSAAGGWLGGFNTSVAGVLAGGILGGIGNGVSTWLAYEKETDEAANAIAFTHLPELVQQIEESEKKLIALIEQVKSLDVPAAPSVVEMASEEPASCMMATRARRNFVYVNVAGWLSAIGGWVGGFFPNAPGILIGGAAGAAANAISTWLVWEKEQDRAMDKSIRNFPNLVLKVNELSSQIGAMAASAA